MLVRIQFRLTTERQAYLAKCRTELLQLQLAVKGQAHAQIRGQLSIANLRNAELHYLYRKKEAKQTEVIALERKKHQKLAREVRSLQQQLQEAHTRERRLKSHIRTLREQHKPRTEILQAVPQLQKEKTKPIELTLKHHQHRQPVV